MQARLPGLFDNRLFRANGAASIAERFACANSRNSIPAVRRNWPIELPDVGDRSPSLFKRRCLHALQSLAYALTGYSAACSTRNSANTLLATIIDSRMIGMPT